MKWIVRVALAIVLLAGIGLFVMIATDPGDNVTLVDAGIRSEPSGGRVVTARLRFVGAQFHVQLDVVFLDENGGVVGRAVVETRNLRAGEAWDIDVPVPADNVVRFRMHNLTCSPTAQSSEWEKRRACALTYEGLIE